MQRKETIRDTVLMMQDIITELYKSMPEKKKIDIYEKYRPITEGKRIGLKEKIVRGHICNLLCETKYRPYLEELTLTEIGLLMGVTRETIRTLEKSSYRKMKNPSNKVCRAVKLEILDIMAVMSDDKAKEQGDNL